MHCQNNTTNHSPCSTESSQSSTLEPSLEQSYVFGVHASAKHKKLHRNTAVLYLANLQVRFLAGKNHKKVHRNTAVLYLAN